jgi:DNA-binding winged helix-turn-helix (wHTH) protein
MADSSSGLRIELLGPVEARVDGRAVALGGQRPRALFAVLALMGGRVVTTERLIDELWGEEPPARGGDSLQMHVSRLRKALSDGGDDGGRLVSQADGYLLDVRSGECDVECWQQALDQTHRARAGGEPQVARQRIHEALSIWRGQSLGGASTNSLLAAERARLEEERLAAIIEGIELDLELGPSRRAPGPAGCAGHRAPLQRAPGGAPGRQHLRSPRQPRSPSRHPPPTRCSYYGKRARPTVRSSSMQIGTVISRPHDTLVPFAGGNAR